MERVSAPSTARRGRSSRGGVPTVLPDAAAPVPTALFESPGTPGPAVEVLPDAVIANLYAPGAKLGLHCDGEEPADAPVVTISLGDTCLFRFAGVERRTAPFVDVWLRSGDLLVFGGATRRIYHGVPKVLTGTAPAGLGLPPGRLSITIRETGLS